LLMESINTPKPQNPKTPKPHSKSSIVEYHISPFC
jgi:hypothetical protein